MGNFTCEHCGAGFQRDRSGARPIRFCTVGCYHAYRDATGYNKSSTFAPGIKPWNKDLKGIHLSPQSEWKPGRISDKGMPVGAIVTRVGKGSTPRQHIKIAEPNVWEFYAVWLYRHTHGPIPKGHVVHHRDHDSLNDTPDNLQRLTRAEHLNVHRAEIMVIKKALQRERIGAQAAFTLEAA